MTRLSPYFHVRVIYFKWCKTLGLYEAHQREEIPELFAIDVV
jgi:hypothetical protein